MCKGGNKMKMEDLPNRPGGVVWVNPFDMDHYDPMNWDNPRNAMYNIAEIIHHADMYMTAALMDEEKIDQEEFLKNIDNLAKLAVLARQELSDSRNMRM